MWCVLSLALLQGSPLTLREQPQDYQLFPRNLITNSAELRVSGWWTPAEAAASLRLELSTSDGQSFVDQVPAEWPQAGSAQPFLLAVDLPAGLIEYDALLVQRHAGVDEVLASWEHLTVGDAYLIHGQSNAVAADYYGEHLANARDQSPWIRSYGSSTTNPLLTAADQAWHLADAEVEGASGAVGVWALHLARRIVEREQVPVALMLGAVGGTRVAQHQRNDQDPEDLDTIYGRLLWRSRHAGLATHYRALFWYQGESDGADAAAWRSGFLSLNQDWAQDYPSLEHLWLIQVRRGCGSPSLELRDIQRRWPRHDARFHLATANGLPTHDGCHFHDAGYLRLAEDLLPQVAHHLYGRPAVTDMEPPDVAQVSWRDPLHQTLVLSFTNVTGPLIVPYNSWDTMTVDDGTPIQSVRSLGDRLEVRLAGPSQATTLRFQGHAFNRPEWIRNSRNLALMSFEAAIH